MDFVSLGIGTALGASFGLAFAFYRSSNLSRQNSELVTRLKLEGQAHEQSMAEMSNFFKATAADALQKNNEQFLQLAQERMNGHHKDAAHDMEKRQKAISDLVDPIGKSLKEMEGKIENLGKAGSALESQIKNMNDAHTLLSAETRSLSEAMRNPVARGNWGEMNLQRTLEMVGMVEGTHYVQQESLSSEGSRIQPDFVIHLPAGHKIIIDVKTPLAPYMDANENADMDGGEAINILTRSVRERMRDLSKKEYWQKFGTAEFVVMFLPTEGLYSLAVSNDRTLLEDAAKHNIILASPTTVMGLLRTVMHGWQQHHMAEEAKQVSETASRLYQRICIFGEHFSKVGKNLDTAVNFYNKAVSSLESRVLPDARKMKELHVQTGGKELPDMTQVDQIAQSLSAPELTHEDAA